jgi:hypothetical protein
VGTGLITRPATPGKRPSVLSGVSAYLATGKRMDHLVVDLTLGLTGGFIAWACVYRWGAAWEQFDVLLITPLFAAFVSLLIVLAAIASLGAVLDQMAKLSGAQRIVLTIVAVAVGWLLIAEAGSALAAIAATVLPAAFVAACGLWACLLTRRKVRTASNRVVRSTADAIAVVAIATAFLLLTDDSLLTTGPAAALLFPLALSGSFKLWRAMRASERLRVKSGADITLSLLLGASLVLFLVWLANLLDLPANDMTRLRSVLSAVGDLADLPWWIWSGLYVLLAGVSLAIVLRRDRLTKVKRWLGRFHVAAAATVTRRALSCVHIGLLVTVFVGLAVPVALSPVFEHQLRSEYVVALQRELGAKGAQAAYQQVAREFDGGAKNPTLSQMIGKINQVGGSSPGGGGIANNLGQLQATTLQDPAAPSLPPTENVTLPIDSSLPGDADEVTAEQRVADEASEDAEEAGDLAAKAVASTISVPGLPANEVLEIVREYLTGLIEESPIKDWFASWAERLGGAEAPPDAETLVVPDPAKLKNAAYTALSDEFTEAGLADVFSASVNGNAAFVGDPALATALGESPLNAAVDLANQGRYLEQNSGSCAGCFSVQGDDDGGNGGNAGDDGGDDGGDGGGGDGGGGGGDGP